MISTVVVDYQICNLGSVRRAFDAVGEQVRISSSREDVERAGRVVLPGVGSFRQGMENLRKLDLIGALKDHAHEGKPLLGLCLGMQLLFDEGNEFGFENGLGLVPGNVEKMQADLPVPHIGWNQIEWTRREKLTENIPSQSYFYFVHSYVCRPQKSEDVLGVTEYGEEFPSVIRHENIYGLQCHPEKSQQPGLTFLANFVKL
ncbi:MAG TPA: imidazole glycerol phosphate synthase subunit HisH [Acidobacteriota bacterium]